MTTRFLRFPLIFSLLLFGACTTLNTRHRQTYSYKTPTRCAQGPFELRIPARGAPWGEQVELDIYSPRKLALRVDYRTDDETEFHKNYLGDENAMENKECLAQAGTSTTPGAGPGEAPGKGPAGQPGTLPPEAPGKTGTPTPELIWLNPEGGKWTPRSSSSTSTTTTSTTTTSTAQRYTLNLFNVRRGGPDEATPFPKGRFIILRIWSVLPNDYENVEILVHHSAYVPYPSEKEYVAKLRKEERGRKREAAKRQRAAERRAAKRQREWERRQIQLARERELAAKNPPKPRPTKPVPPPRAAKPQKVKPQTFQACVTGRHDGRRVQICRKFTDLNELWRCQKDPADLECWHRPRKGRWHYNIAEAPKPTIEDNRPKPRPADGPPPAPQAETQPPRASENAVWVPGYWRWNGFRWLWLYGFWRVPQSDLEQEKTATAPAEPPPAQVETVVAAPFPDAVWTPGYWHWQAGAWVWVSGRWLVPPASDNQWRRPVWRRTPRGVILIPGHWIRR